MSARRRPQWIGRDEREQFEVEAVRAALG